MCGVETTCKERGIWLMTERELLELLVKQVAGIDKRLDRQESRFDGLESRFDGLESRFDGLESRFDGLETRFDGLDKRVGAIEIDLASVKETVVRIENEHGQQLKALLDGQVHMAEMLERIAIEISHHEEIVFRRAT